MRLLKAALLGLAAFALSGASGGAMQSSSEQREKAKEIKNPVASDEASLEEGRKLYALHCASCHGPQGKGDGGMALSGGTPSNLVDEKWDYGGSDGEIFVVIRDGVSNDMEGYKERLSEKQIWHIINYLRSIGPKPAGKR